MTPVLQSLMLAANLDMRGTKFLAVFTSILGGAFVTWTIKWSWKNRKAPIFGRTTCGFYRRDTEPIMFWLYLIGYAGSEIALMVFTILLLAKR